ncbi:hypothetical protein Ari01nite_19490 [Paractinoplanes rishiriensis]|uniref:Uncharacterized protein n=1 Tax=Paractinoplanes rishiriensis TaxID=1050105 RepID=A0A919JVT6_9ACTN|nr:hypothetical protein Ari01nite_19490 [Actinoplanes rishiriensis]
MLPFPHLKIKTVKHRLSSRPVAERNPLHPQQFPSRQRRTTPLNTIQLNTIQLNTIQLNTIQLNHSSTHARRSRLDMCMHAIKSSQLNC